MNAQTPLVVTPWPSISLLEVVLLAEGDSKSPCALQRYSEVCLNEADEAIAGCRTQRSVALKGKSAVFTPLVIPLSKSFYPVMTGLRGTCSFNGGGEKKIKLRAFHSFICHPAASYLSLHYLCSLLLPSCVLARLSLSFSSDRRLLGRRENPPPAVLSARAQPFHTTPLSTVDQLQATPAAFSSSRKKKKKPAIWITPTMKLRRRRRQQQRPSGGRRLKVVHHTVDAISVALYIKQAPSLILNPIG